MQYTNLMTAKKALLVATGIMPVQDILMLLEITKTKGKHSSKSFPVTHNPLSFVP